MKHRHIHIHSGSARAPVHRLRFTAASTAVILGAAALGGATGFIRASAHHFGQPRTTPSPASGTVGTGLGDVAHLLADVTTGREIHFQLWGPGNPTCDATGAPVFTDVVVVTHSGVIQDVPTDKVYVANQAGTYHWTAQIVDVSHAPSVVEDQSACADEPVTITRADARTSTSQSPSSATVPVDLSDHATVTGGSPSGHVTFKLYGPTTDANACTGTPVVNQDVTLVSGAAASPVFHATSPGRYDWVVTYAGDGNNNPSSSQCGQEVVRVDKAEPEISTEPSDGGSVGSDITDEATVSGGFHPTGTVTFNLYAPGDTECEVSLRTETVPLSEGAATSAPFTTGVAGTYRWTATYNGDANNRPATSGCGEEEVTITKGTLQISTTPSAGGVVGVSVSDQATLSGGFNPTGTVTFNLYGPDDPTCAHTPVFTDTRDLGVASKGFQTSAVGTYHWIAIYNGDANNGPVSGQCADEPVTTTTASAGIATTPSAGGDVGTSIHDTATVTGLNPTGTVTFTLYSASDPTCSQPPVFTSGPVALSGGSAASASYAAALAGTYQWKAAYSGDPHNSAAVSGCGAEPVAIAAGGGTAGITTPPGGGTGGLTTPNTGADVSVRIGLGLVAMGVSLLLASAGGAPARRQRRPAQG